MQNSCSEEVQPPVFAIVLTPASSPCRISCFWHVGVVRRGGCWEKMRSEKIQCTKLKWRRIKSNMRNDELLPTDSVSHGIAEHWPYTAVGNNTICRVTPPEENVWLEAVELISLSLMYESVNTWLCSHTRKIRIPLCRKHFTSTAICWLI